MYLGFNNSFSQNNILENIITPKMIYFPWSDYSKSPVLDNAMIFEPFNIYSGYRNFFKWTDKDNNDIDLVDYNQSDWWNMSPNASTGSSNYQGGSWGPCCRFLQTNRNIKNISLFAGVSSTNEKYVYAFIFNNSLHYMVHLLNPLADGQYTYEFAENYDTLYIDYGCVKSTINNSYKPKLNDTIISFTATSQGSYGASGAVLHNIKAGDIYRHYSGTSVSNYKALLFAFDL